MAVTLVSVEGISQVREGPNRKLHTYGLVCLYSDCMRDHFDACRCPC